MEFRLPKSKAMLRRAAAEWLARLHSGRDPDVERKLRAWRDADPRHAAAFDRVLRSYEQAGLLRHAARPPREAVRPAVRHSEPRPRRALAAAAAIAVLLPGGILLVRSGPRFGATNAVMLTTRVGEIRRVALADGSKVTLDTATKFEVLIGRSHRSARLSSGRVRLEIARGDQPFVVQTASATVSAREGVIDVERGDGHDRVRVLTGAADVRAVGQEPGSHLAVGAGHAVTVDPGRAQRADSMAPGVDWTRGMLQFDATPLREAVALANRYSDQPIVLDPDLQGLRVTGAFRAGDTAGLARALAAAFGLSLRQSVDGRLLLSPEDASQRRTKRGG